MGLLDRIRKTPPPEPDRAPASVTGRGHVDGFLQLEELNVDLQGRQGLEIFDKMYRTDGDVKQVMGLTSNPIVAGTWVVIPAGGKEATPEQVEDAEFARWAIFENMTPNLKGHLMEALPVLFRSGFAPFEAVWMSTDYKGTTVLVPRTLSLRLPRTIYRWKQDVYGGLEAIEQYLPVPKAQVVAGPNVIIPGNPVQAGDINGGGGTDDTSISDPTIITDTRSPDYRQTVWIPAQDLVYYRVGAEGDNWEGQSLLRPAYKHWFLKDVIEKVDAIAQEREAVGIPVCYPPLGATPDQLDAMQSIMGNMRTNEQGYVLMPGPKAGPGTPDGQGWFLEILGQHAEGRDPQPSLAYHSDKIAASFIAEFIRQGHSLSNMSRGAAAAPEDPFLISIEAFVGLIEDILNEQIIAPLIAYNRPNAVDPPSLRMSLVDATSLTQLADFVLKLVQVGAIMADQELEDFLRARADLPPADPELTRARSSEQDQETRQEILIGKQNNGMDPGTSGGSAPKPGKGSAGPGGKKATAQSTNLDDLPSEDSFAPYMPGTERVRWRPVAWYELNTDLDGIEDRLDAAPERMVDATRNHVIRLSRAAADSYPKRIRSDKELDDCMMSMLSDDYDYGAQTVSSEIERRTNADSPALARLLDRGANDRGRRAMHTRAKVAGEHVRDAIYHAVAHSDLHAGDEGHHRQAAAERAGVAAARQIGFSHSIASFQQGRHDKILAAASSMPDYKWGVRYTAILDKNTCQPCRDADDGQVRSLDDPVRIANRPPNQHCDSTSSGRNQCRCFEIPEPMPQNAG